MSAESPSLDRSRLDARIHPDHDYTHGDAVIDTLIEFISCPLVLDVMCPMLIFNNQCYEINAFERYIDSENERKNLSLSSGYSPASVKFIDPRTREEFVFHIALSQMIHRHIPISELKEMLVSRISGLTLEESSVYVPGHNDVSESILVDDFVCHVNNLRAPRAVLRQLYRDRINDRARNGLSDQPVQNTILRQNQDLVVAPHPDEVPYRRVPLTQRDNSTPSSSSASDDDNANDNFFQRQRNRINTISQTQRTILDISSDDDENIVDALLVNNDREVSSTSEEGSIVENAASSPAGNRTPPSLVNLTATTTTISTRQSLVSMRPPQSLTPSSTRLVSDESSPTENNPPGDIDRLPTDPSSTVEQAVAVSQLTQVENNESSLPWMPPWTNNTVGEGLCHSLLSQAHAEEWKNSIGFGKRRKWLDDKLELFYDRGVGIFKAYKSQSAQILQQKLSLAEAVAKNLYDGRQHNSDTTGNSDESQPVFCLLFF